MRPDTSQHCELSGTVIDRCCDKGNNFGLPGVGWVGGSSLGTIFNADELDYITATDGEPTSITAHSIVHNSVASLEKGLMVLVDWADENILTISNCSAC